MNDLSFRYANALFSLKKETNQLVDSQNEVKELIKIIKDNPEYLTLLDSASISKEKRISLIDEAFNNVDEEIKTLIKIVIENNRAKYLLDVLESYSSLVNEYRQIMEGLLYSSVALSEKQIRDIESSISQKEGHQVELKNLIDPSLIGGVKVVINNHIYDGSIKHHLEQMKIALLK